MIPVFVSQHSKVCISTSEEDAEKQSKASIQNDFAIHEASEKCQESPVIFSTYLYQNKLSSQTHTQTTFLPVGTK